MRKKIEICKKVRVLCCVFIAGMLVIGITSCGKKKDGIQPETQLNTEKEQEGDDGEQSISDSLVEEANTLFGQITEVQGNTITLALAEQPSVGEGTPGDRPDGKESGYIPEAGPGVEDAKGIPEAGPDVEDAEAIPGDWPSGEIPNGAPGDGPSGKAPEDFPEGMLGDGAPSINWKLTGETKIIQVLDSTIITVNGEEASISDLYVGDIVVVLMESDAVNSITVTGSNLSQ